MDPIITFTAFGLPIITLSAMPILSFLISRWLVERLKTYLQKEQSIFLEDLKWDMKVREQALRVAEFLALVNRLKTESSNAADLQKANQLSWELAMWLDDKIYKELCHSMKTPDEILNTLTIVVSVRKIILGDKAGGLNASDIIHF